MAGTRRETFDVDKIIFLLHHQTSSLLQNPFTNLIILIVVRDLKQQRKK